MSEVYIAVRRTGDPNEELQHYGVKGMRWGVRRATKQLSKATTKEQHDKAVAKLEKHRTKSVKKVQQLETKQDKLNKQLQKSAVKDTTKASKLESKASKLDAKYSKNMRKASRMFVIGGDKRRNKLVRKATIAKFKSDRLHSKASAYKANYESTKAKVESNELLIKAFKQAIRDIDAAEVNKGRRYING